MVVQEFDLNLIPSSAPVVIHVDQYDKGNNRLLIHLYDGDTPYVPETAATVEIQGVKPDTKGFQYYADIDGSTVTADVVMQMTACAGRVKTQIVVTETTGRTGTFDFILDVQESALPAIVDISETELPIIIEGAQAQADAAAASAAQAAASEQLAAEHVAATAENANRAIAEANRAEAEADRAETSRAVAEDAEAWAVGERGGVPVEEGDETYENNAKWYSEQIGTEKEDAEAWAVGERGGVPVSSDDPTYHNNAKFWSDKSGTSRLSALDDVAVASVQDGDLIHYDEEEEKWVNSKVNVEDLGNAEITNVQDGESLMYDDIKHKWVNKIASTKYIPKPTATGFVFTYDGTEQGPTITGLEPDWDKYMTITDAKATNAGAYTLTFSLRNTQLYAWADFSTQDITYSWEIEKTTGSVTLSDDEITLDADHPSATVSVLNATGTVTVSSSDITVATAVIAGNTISILSVNDTTGTATITVSVAASDNYLATSKTIAVDATFLEFVTWADGTDKQIVTMLNAHYAGKIDIHDYWEVGDERTVSLSGMTGMGSGSPNPAQNVVLVLVEDDPTDYTLVSDTTKHPAFIVQQKDGLSKKGSINSVNDYSGSWAGCPARTWCNTEYKNAIPSTLVNAFKQVNVKTAAKPDGLAIQTSQDYFFFPAEREIFDTRTNSYSVEFQNLTQWKYYKTSANRIKNVSGSPSTWPERSPSTNGGYSVCYVSKTGEADWGTVAGSRHAIVPAGCI